MSNNSRTNLPTVTSQIPPDLRQFLERVRESLSGDTYVRRTDYIGGTVPRYPNDPPAPVDPPGPGPGPSPLPCGDPVTPTAPTGFHVAPGFSGFLLSWDMPGYCGHSHTEVYGLRHDGSASDLTVNNMLGDSKGVMYSHVVDKPNDFWCFWIKHVNMNDVEGPFCETHLCATTAIDPGAIIDSIKGRITESELYRNLGERIKLIDVTRPLSTLTNIAGISGRVFYSTTAPTNVTADPDLAAGDLWVDTDDYVGTPPNGYYKTYRYSGSTWILLGDVPNQLGYAFYNEQLVRADADSIEASKREGLFAGAFAGIGNTYKYFIQGPLSHAPTGTQVGDIWAYKDPENDADSIFKRFNGNNWVNTPPTEDAPTNPNADSERRPAKFWGNMDAPPTVGLVIGDQYLHTKRYLSGTTPDPKYNQIYVYNAIGAPNGPWVLTTTDTAMAAALVYREQYVRVDEDANVLAQATELVYAAAGDSRANICPNASFEDDPFDVIGSTAGFAVLETNFGRAYRKVGSFTESFQFIGMPPFPVPSAGGRQYSLTGNARIYHPNGATGNSCQFGLMFYSTVDGTGTPLATYYAPSVATDPAAGGMDFYSTYTVNGATISQRRKFAYQIPVLSPVGAQSARFLFRWSVSGATQVAFTRPQVVVGTLPMPAFYYDSTSAMVADVATARIGYCTVGTSGSTVPTDHTTRSTCTAAGNTWHVGLPWASAVKQVVIATTDKCYLNGTLGDVPDTQAACEAAQGTGDYLGIPGIWVPGNTAAIQQQFEAIQRTTGDLYAQYTVKIDVGGHIAGFGLSIEDPIDGPATSSFGVRADRFFVAGATTASATPPINPYKGQVWFYTGATGGGYVKNTVYYYTGTAWSTSASTANVPFIITTSPQCLVGGVNRYTTYPTQAACEATSVKGTWVPIGIYAQDAFIQNAVISWAQIKEATIDTAYITRAVIGNLTADGVQVGNCIKSATWYDPPTNTIPMWSICGGGNAVFNNASIRGQIVGGSATAVDAGSGYFLGSVGSFRVGDPAGANMLWTQSAGTLAIKGNLRGGLATNLTTGTGYYLGADGTFRVGVPGGKSLSWDGSGLLLTGTARSTNWNGTLDANGVILTGASADNTGWIIDNAGNAEFTTVHLRQGSVSSFTKGTSVYDSTFEDGDGIPIITARLVAYVDVTHPLNGTGVIIQGAVDLKSKLAHKYGAAVYVTRRAPSAINPLADGHTGRVLVYETAPTDALMAANGLSNLATGDYWYRESNGLFSRYTGSAWVTVIMTVLDGLGVALPYVGSSINAWVKPGQEAAPLYFSRPSGFIVDSTSSVTFNSGRTVRYSYYVHNKMDIGKIYWGAGQILAVMMNR